MLPQNVVECSYCNSLEQLYKRLECSILDLSINKYNSYAYNVDSYFDQTLMNDLIRYKRIINSRMYNSAYPCCTINLDDIITKAALIAYVSDCNDCEDCFPTIPTSTTTTTTSFNTTTTTTTTAF